MSSPVYYYNGSPYAAHVPLPPSPYGSPYGSPYNSPYGVHIALPPSPIGYAVSVPLPPSPIPGSIPIPRTPTRNPLPLPPSPNASITTASIAAGTEFTPHRLLALDPQDPAIAWDVRLPPDTIRLSAPPYRPLATRYLDQPALSPPWTFVRLRSTLLPWLVEVSNPQGVTVGDVLNAVYGCLRDRVDKDEWRDASSDFQERLLETWGRRSSMAGEEMGRAARAKEEERGVRRVDWLLWDIEWLGIERSKSELETWDMHFRSR